MSASPSSTATTRMIPCSDGMEAHLCDSTNTTLMLVNSSSSLHGLPLKGESTALKSMKTMSSSDDEEEEQKEQHPCSASPTTNQEPPKTSTANTTTTATAATTSTLSQEPSSASSTLMMRENKHILSSDILTIKSNTVKSSKNNDDMDAVSVGLMASGLAWVKRQNGYRRRLEQRRYMDDQARRLLQATKELDEEDERIRLLELEQQQQQQQAESNHNSDTCPTSPPPPTTTTTTTGYASSLWPTIGYPSPVTPAKQVIDNNTELIQTAPNSAPLVPRLTSSIYSISNAIMMPAYACTSYDADDILDVAAVDQEEDEQESMLISKGSSSDNTGSREGRGSSDQQENNSNELEKKRELQGDHENDRGYGPSGASLGFFCGSDDTNVPDAHGSHDNEEPNDDDDTPMTNSYTYPTCGGNGSTPMTLVEQAQTHGAVSVLAQVLAKLSYDDGDDDDGIGDEQPPQDGLNDHTPHSSALCLSSDAADDYRHGADEDDNFMTTAYQVCRRPEASQMLLPDIYNDEDEEDDDSNDDENSQYNKPQVVHVEETLDEKNDVSWIPPVRLVPELSTHETILTPAQQHSIATSVLPKSIACCRWNRLYSLGRDGDSFDVCLYKIRQQSPTLLVVRTTRGAIFGAFCGGEWEPTGDFHGNSETCLYTFPQTEKNAGMSPGRDSVGRCSSSLAPTPERPSTAHDNETCTTPARCLTPARCPTPASLTTQMTFPFTPPRPLQHHPHNEASLLDTDDDSVDEEDDEKTLPEITMYRYTGVNRYIQVCDVSKTLLAFGGGGDGASFGLCLEQDFQRGSTGPCDTFGNEPLCAQDNFKIVDVELWGFVTGQF